MPKDSFINLERYNKLISLGKDILSESDVVKSGTVSLKDVELAREFMATGAKTTNPQVKASYWEHITIAPELGRRIALQMAKTDSSISLHEIEFLLFLHDIGRLITPSIYFRNDLIGDRVLLGAGIPKHIVGDLPPLGNILVKADELELTESQIEFAEPFTSEQLTIAKRYFDSLTPTQRIILFADNLGKRDDRGLFDLDSFFSYLKGYDALYDHNSPWSSVEWATTKRKAALPLVLYVTEKTVEWFYQNGVNVEEIMTGLEDYGPKFVLIARHGELDNPDNIVYNRDSVMKTPMHLSSLGKEYMYEVGKLIKTREFNLTRIFTSPETRAHESVFELNKTLKLPTEMVDDLDDVFAPDPYNEGWKMERLIALGGNSYNLPHTESPEKITQRMLNVFSTTAHNLKTGQAAILLSHGDPITFLIHMLTTNSVLNPEKIRKVIFPKKGQATIAVIGPDGKLFTLYFLNEDVKENSY